MQEQVNPFGACSLNDEFQKALRSDQMALRFDQMTLRFDQLVLSIGQNVLNRGWINDAE